MKLAAKRPLTELGTILKNCFKQQDLLYNGAEQAPT